MLENIHKSYFKARWQNIIRLNIVNYEFHNSVGITEIPHFTAGRFLLSYSEKKHGPKECVLLISNTNSNISTSSHTINYIEVYITYIHRKH